MWSFTLFVGANEFSILFLLSSWLLRDFDMRINGVQFFESSLMNQLDGDEPQIYPSFIND